MRILIIEDNQTIADPLKEELEHCHYNVEVRSCGESGYLAATTNEYDLIILDVMLPKLDGITLCHKYRNEQKTTPILMLTAKTAKADRISGLDAGADDYVLKPFDIDELLARVRALLRRSTPPESSIEFGDLLIDSRMCSAKYCGKDLGLTPTEFRLLLLFARNPKQIFDKYTLIDRLWTADKSPSGDAIKSHIKALRKKFASVCANDPVETVYGFGYRFRSQC